MWLRAGVGDLSRETAVALPCSFPCGVETGGTFARVYLRRVETGITFAGQKWVLLVRLSVAVVLSVSTVAVSGRAAVSGVLIF